MQHRHTLTHIHKLTLRTHFPLSVHLSSDTPQSTPHLVHLPDLFSSHLLKTSHHAVCVCVCGLDGTSVVPLSCYHSLCLFSMRSACTPCWFYSSAAVWGSLGEQSSPPTPLSLYFSLSFFNLYTHKAWAIRHASVCVSTLS